MLGSCCACLEGIWRAMDEKREEEKSLKNQNLHGQSECVRQSLGTIYLNMFLNLCISTLQLERNCLKGVIFQLYASFI